MTGREYFKQLQEIIASTIFVLDSQMHYTEIDVNECYIRGVLTLLNGYQLHIAEYVITEPTLLRTKYRYHLQDQTLAMVVRWDNAPHYKNVSTFPDHIHKGDGSVQPSPTMDIPSVLAALIPYLK